MYKVTNNEDYLVVRFKANFTCNDLRIIIRHELLVPECAHMNDIWLIGKHHAQISMGELLSIIDDFKHLHPKHAEGKKTAIVVEQGLTEAIMQLLANGLKNQLPFECRLFHKLEEAEAWMGVAETKVA